MSARPSALRAELVKLTTTWVWWLLLVVALGLVLLNVGLLVALAPVDVDAGAPDLTGLPSLGTTAGQLAVVGSGYQSGYLLAAVLGVLVSTSDHRAGTIAQTFLAHPRRLRVVLAKLVTGALGGLVYGVVVQAVSLAVAVAGLRLRGAEPAPAADLVRPVLLGVLGVTVWGVVGVAVGLLVRRQVIAVVGLVLVVFLLDPLAGLALGQAGDVGGLDLSVAAPYLLSNASAALVEGFTGSDLLPWWGGLLVLLGWVAALTAAAVPLTLRRDVT